MDLRQSDGNHSSKGGFVRRLFDLSWIGSFRHNISHAATANYGPRADTMLLGNGGGMTFRGSELLVAAIREDNYHSNYRFNSMEGATNLQQ